MKWKVLALMTLLPPLGWGLAQPQSNGCLLTSCNCSTCSTILNDQAKWACVFDCKALHVSGKLFGQQKLQRLLIADSRIINVDCNASENLKNLTHLVIERSSFELHVFQTILGLAMPALEYLRLFKVRDIGVLGPKIFKVQQSLRSIIIEQSNIASGIRNGAFMNLKHLNFISLRGDGLKAFSTHWFDAPTLNRSSFRLDLRDNVLNCECLWIGIIEKEWMKDNVILDQHCASSLDLLNANGSLKACRPPEVVTPFTEVISPPASHVTLSCEASGNPRPILSWLDPQGNELQSQTINVSDFEVSSQITIPSILVLSGLYMCRSQNSYGESTAFIHLVINPTLIHKTFRSFSPALMFGCFGLLIVAVAAFLISMKCCKVYSRCRNRGQTQSEESPNDENAFQGRAVYVPDERKSGYAAPDNWKRVSDRRMEFQNVVDNPVFDDFSEVQVEVVDLRMYLQQTSTGVQLQ